MTTPETPEAHLARLLRTPPSDIPIPMPETSDGHHAAAVPGEHHAHHHHHAVTVEVRVTVEDEED